MKKGKRKKRRSDVFKTTMMRNNLMNRFIHEIEREEPLEREILNTMLVF